VSDEYERMHIMPVMYNVFEFTGVNPARGIHGVACDLIFYANKVYKLIA
jgi:hypothetical protein